MAGHIGGGIERLLDHPLAILDRRLDAGLDKGLAGEAGEIDLAVAGHHDGAGPGYLLRARTVSHPDGAVGFDLDLITQFGGGLLQRLGG